QNAKRIIVINIAKNPAFVSRGHALLGPVSSRVESPQPMKRSLDMNELSAILFRLFEQMSECQIAPRLLGEQGRRRLVRLHQKIIVSLELVIILVRSANGSTVFNTSKYFAVDVKARAFAR